MGSIIRIEEFTSFTINIGWIKYSSHMLLNEQNHTRFLLPAQLQGGSGCMKRLLHGDKWGSRLVVMSSKDESPIGSISSADTPLQRMSPPTHPNS